MEYFTCFNKVYKFLEIYERISQEKDIVMEHVQFSVCGNEDTIFTSYEILLNEEEFYVEYDSDIEYDDRPVYNCKPALRIYEYIKCFVECRHPEYVERHVFVDGNGVVPDKPNLSHMYSAFIYFDSVKVHLDGRRK